VASAENFIAALERARTAIRSGDPGMDTASWRPVAPPPPPPGVAAGGGRKNWPWVVAVVLVLLAGGALAFALTRPDMVEVPNEIGKPATEAVADLSKKGLEVEQKPVKSDAPVGNVVQQDPKPGEKVEKGSTVTLGVSSGPGKRIVPDVEGKSQEDAVRALTRAKFTFTLDNEPSSKYPKGIVTRTDPEGGTEAEAGSRVQVFVSSGPEQVTVPKVTGLKEDEARAEVRDAGLRPIVNEVESDAPKGEVTAQSPGAGATVDKGSRVKLSVSKGREQVEVPDVTGMTAEEARTTLEDAGFKVKEVDRPGPPEDEGLVVDQAPSSGKRPKGSTVTIYVGSPDTGGGGTGTP
jgi:eukaryotic-like serine/threonine-protein kinase